MPDKFLSNFTDQYLRAQVDFIVPNFLPKNDFDLWAFVLLEKNQWEAFDPILDQGQLDEQTHLFIASFLETLRLFCELGRLPTFELPKIISLVRDPSTPKKFFLEIKLVRIQFISDSIYQILLKHSLNLCGWMAQNSPSSENKKKLFDAISQDVIKPLHQLVHARKSTIPVLRAAHRLGIPFAHIGLGVYQLGWGSKARLLSGSITQEDSSIGSSLSTDKFAAARILRLAGLPGPEHFLVTTLEKAQEAAKKLGFPIVVKPVDQDRGLGVTVDVIDDMTLNEAFSVASQYARHNRILIERQVVGICHRVFIANHRVLYVVKRFPISILGDGQRSIREIFSNQLFLQEQKPPWARLTIPPLDTLALECLANAGFSPDSIPPLGQLVPLRKIESTEWGGLDEDLTHAIHPDNIAIAMQAAKLFHLQHAGIDIITSDISRPWYETNAIINEVNLAPLLGGAEISRSYLPQFFAHFIDGDGKIPIQAFENEEKARLFQSQLQEQGKRCYLVNKNQIIDSKSQVITMNAMGVKAQLRALITRSDVDAIAVVNS